MSQDHRGSPRDGSIGRRRYLKAAGASTVLATALAGCSGESGGGANSPTQGGGTDTSDGTDTSGSGTTTGTTGPITLEMWMGTVTEGRGKREYINEVVSSFESDHDASLQIQRVAFEDINTQMRAAQAAGNQPHLVETNANPTVLAGDTCRPINDLIESSNTADIVSEGILDMHETWGAQATAEDGTLLTWPIGFRPYLTCWREDWLDQADIDPTEVNHEAGSLSYYDDLTSILGRMQDTELASGSQSFPSATGMKQSDCEYLAHYVGQFGGPTSGIVNETGTRATINDSEAREAIRMQFDFIDQELFDPNSLNYGDEETTTKQWSGQHGMNHIQDSTDLWADYLEEQPEAMRNGQYHWGVPFQQERKHSLVWLPSFGFVDGAGWDQESLDLAAQFLDMWATDPEWSRGNASDLGWVPVNPNAIRERDFFGQTEMHERYWRGAAVRTLEEFTFGSVPAVPGNSTISFQIPRQMYQRIFQGESIERATSRAEEDINGVLAEHGRR